MAHWVCEECGCDFKRDRSGERPIRFCGADCYHRWQQANTNKGRFRRGQRPWNKDKKGLHLSPNTEFKPGHRSNKRAPVGTVRIRKRNRPAGHITRRAYIKVAHPNKWMKRCQHIWEQRHGPIPRTMIIHHIDNDPLNDELTNLALVTRGTHAYIHGKKRGGLNPKT